MQFSTNRLTIRNVTDADWYDIREIWNSLKDSPFAMYDKPTDICEQAVRERVAKWSGAAGNPDHQFFSVILNGKIIGYAAFNIRSDGYETGYPFHNAFHGMGYAKESITALLDHMKNVGAKKIMTCVMLTGGIDISVGSLVAMNCMLLVNSMRNGANCYVVCLEVLIIGVVFGFVQGWFVSYMKVQPFIVTMAGMSFARGMTAVINTRQISITQADNPVFYSWANAKIYLPEFLGYANKKGKIMIPFIYPAVIVALICVVIVFLFLRYSKTGRGFYAIGGNETSAAMMGLNTRKTKLKAYILCSFLTAVGSICFCLNSMQGSVQQATGMEMDAIASAVIGGTLLTGGVGNVFGSFIGVLINGTIAAAVKSNGKLLSSWANIVTAALLCFFIVLQSFFAYLKRRSK